MNQIERYNQAAQQLLTKALQFSIAEEAGESTHGQRLELEAWARAYHKEWLAVTNGTVHPEALRTLGSDPTRIDCRKPPGV